MATRRLTIELSDVDRNLYETLELVTAQHPSENDAFFVTRSLAFALSYAPGITFSSGLGVPDEPAVWIRDDTGQELAWIEVGKPKVERLERGLRAAGRVDVYCHKPDPAYLKGLEKVRVPRGARLVFQALDPGFIDEVASSTRARSTWSLTRSEGSLFLDVEGRSSSCDLGDQPRRTFEG